MGEVGKKISHTRENCAKNKKSCIASSPEKMFPHCRSKIFPNRQKKIVPEISLKRKIPVKKKNKQKIGEA